jgi:hypothetical protein
MVYEAIIESGSTAAQVLHKRSDGSQSPLSLCQEEHADRAPDLQSMGERAAACLFIIEDRLAFRVRQGVGDDGGLSRSQIPGNGTPIRGDRLNKFAPLGHQPITRGISLGPREHFPRDILRDHDLGHALEEIDGTGA